MQLSVDIHMPDKSGLPAKQLPQAVTGNTSRR
jgi:hypothetical protein